MVKIGILSELGFDFEWFDLAINYCVLEKKNNHGVMLRMIF